jgi:crotonobetainyl-CoA:carnitine CoA-transferase CaiB-like acyl-CoA transferase
MIEGSLLQTLDFPLRVFRVYHRNDIPVSGTARETSLTKGPLANVRVLDVATLFAGPLGAMLLGDFGADVIKVEHPRGDPVRTHGHMKDGVNLWWKMISRNKRAITLNLSMPEGQELMAKLVSTADVMIENFRPGTLERWGLGPDYLAEINPRLILARVTGFGQKGPYAHRPGFGTLAEALSGFAMMTGEPNGPPTLPPFGLADGIAALAVANAIQMALYHRDVNGGSGQIVDLAIIEPIMTVLGPQPIWFDQLGVVQERTGNRSINSSPRNVYRSREGRWLAVSASAQNVAERVMRLIGHPEMIDEEWFRSGRGRAEHAAYIDELVGSWIAERSSDEVLTAFESAQAAIAPIYDIEDIFDDPHYRAIESITTIEDEQLGPIRMQNVMFRLSESPGSIRWSGPTIGQHNYEIFHELGLNERDIDGLTRRGVV